MISPKPRFYRCLNGSSLAETIAIPLLISRSLSPYPHPRHFVQFQKYNHRKRSEEVSLFVLALSQTRTLQTRNETHSRNVKNIEIYI